MLFVVINIKEKYQLHRYNAFFLFALSRIEHSKATFTVLCFINWTKSRNEKDKNVIYSMQLIFIRYNRELSGHEKWK